MEYGSHRVPPWADPSHVEYMEGKPLVKMIHDDLIEGRISIDTCRDIIRYLHDRGAPARHPLEDILAINGQRAGDAANRVTGTDVVNSAVGVDRRNPRIASS